MFLPFSKILLMGCEFGFQALDVEVEGNSSAQLLLAIGFGAETKYLPPKPGMGFEGITSADDGPLIVGRREGSIQAGGIERFDSSQPSTV